MLNLLLICFIAGGAGAILQGMIGIGTGVIIVPLLMFILPQYGISSNMAAHIALATSMAAISTNSISALISHYHRKNIKWSMFKEIILFSITGSCLGALLASQLSGYYLRAIFGVFLLLTAFYMLIKKSSGEMTDTIPDMNIGKIAIGGLSIGTVASLIGSGGGVLMVPFLHSLKLKMRYAVGTSTLIGFPVAVVGAATYIILGKGAMPDSNVTLGYLHWPAFLAITCAGMLCAPLGVRWATVLPTTLLQRIFAVIIFFIGIKMVV